MIFAGEEILLDPFSRRSLRRTYPFSVFHRHAVDVSDPLAHLAAVSYTHLDVYKRQRPVSSNLAAAAAARAAQVPVVYPQRSRFPPAVT